MNIKVKEVSGTEQKSRAEVEEELLAKAAAANEGNETNLERVETSTESAPAPQVRNNTAGRRNTNSILRVKRGRRSFIY